MTTGKEEIEKAVAEAIKKNLCPTCGGQGAIATGKPGDFASIPCRKCKGTGKRPEDSRKELAAISDANAKRTIEDLPKSVEQMIREPDMRERGAGVLLQNVLMHMGQFVNLSVRSLSRGTKPSETAIGMVNDMKQLIKEYEETYGEVR